MDKLKYSNYSLINMYKGGHIGPHPTLITVNLSLITKLKGILKWEKQL